MGLDTSKTGDAAYRQAFTDGTNVLGLIPGKDLPNEYVIVGGHYDHLGTSCRNASPADTICNGATDNAAGAAAALEVGRALASIPGGPHRSVIVALWDREEDGLLGSQVLHATPARAERRRRRVRELRHPGLEPAAEPAELQLRGRRRDGRRAAHPGGAVRRRHHAGHASGELDLRSGTQRLRELHERRHPERVLQRLDRPLLPHRRRRGGRGRLRQARQAGRDRDGADEGPRQRRQADVRGQRTARDLRRRRLAAGRRQPRRWPTSVGSTRPSNSSCRTS